MVKILDIANTLMEPDPQIDEFTEAIVEYIAARINKDPNAIAITKNHAAVIVGKIVIDQFESTLNVAGKWLLRRMKS